MDDDFDLEEDWYPDDPIEAQLGRRQFCDAYDVHGPHNYRALNGYHFDCPGMSQEDAAALDELANAAPCEHGLSAQLCAGPGHYPMDRD